MYIRTACPMPLTVESRWIDSGYLSARAVVGGWCHAAQRLHLPPSLPACVPARGLLLESLSRSLPRTGAPDRTIDT